MFSIIDYGAEGHVLDSLMQERVRPPSEELDSVVLESYSAVNSDGVSAIHRYTRQFDCEDFKEENIFLADEFVEDCVTNLDPELRSAVSVSTNNVKKVNKKIVEHIFDWNKELHPGHIVGERVFPLESTLLWVPAKKGPLISTAIMLCASAAVAGVEKIVLGTPPNASGLPDKNTIAAAKLAGATDFVCGNGLTIVAAAALGKWRHGQMRAIFGPGPQAVALAMANAAKYGVATQPGIGPSDSLIVFDQLSLNEASELARDFLTEIEHGTDSFTYALTTDETSAKALKDALDAECANLFGKNRAYEKIANSNHAAILTFDSANSLITFANDFGAEHLLIYETPEQSLSIQEKLTTAGEILVGKFTPFVAANYCIGVTAVLPTNGFSRSYSGITSRNFLRFSTHAQLNRNALLKLVPTIEAIGSAEGLPNHVQGAKARYKKQS